MSNKQLEYPLLNPWQHFTIYATHNRYIVVAMNKNLSKGRILKVDRMDQKDLNIIEDPHEYSSAELRQLLGTIELGNSRSGGFSRTIHCHGIVGFIKFLEGYYMILITRRKQVARIGYHRIYKIDETAILSLANEDMKKLHPDENKYLRAMQNVDLTNGFYFSYTYDLTHTLQYNMIRQRETEDKSLLEDGFCLGTRYEPAWKFVWNEYLQSPIRSQVHSRWLLCIVHGVILQYNLNVFCRSVFLTLICRRSQFYSGTRFLKRGGNARGHVANEVETEQILHDTSMPSLRQSHFTSFVQLRGSVPAFWSQDPKQVPKPPIVVDMNDPSHVVASQHFRQLFNRYGAPILVLNLVKKHEKKKQEQTLSNEFANAIDYVKQFIPDENCIQYYALDMARINRVKPRGVMPKLDEIARRYLQQTGFFQNFSMLVNDKQFFYDRENVLRLTPFQDFFVQTGVARVNCVDCLDRTNTAMFAVARCALGYQLFSMGLTESPHLQEDSAVELVLKQMFDYSGDILAQQYAGSQLVHRIDTYKKLTPAWSSQSRDIVQTLSRYYSNTFADNEKQHSMNLFLGIFRPKHGRPHFWELTSDYHLHDPRLTSGYLPPHWTNFLGDEIWFSLPLPAEQALKSAKECMEVVKLKPDDPLVDGFMEYYSPDQLTVFEEKFEWQMESTNKDTIYNYGNIREFTPFSIRESKRKSLAPFSLTADVQQKALLATAASTSNSTQNSNQEQTSDEELIEESESDDENTRKQLLIISKKTSKSKLNNRIVNDDSNQNLSQVKRLIASIFPSTKDVYGFELGDPAIESLQSYETYARIAQDAFAPLKKHLQTEQQAILELSMPMKRSNSANSDFEYLPSVNSSTPKTSSVSGRKDGIIDIEQSDSLMKSFFMEPTVSEESLRIYRESVDVAENGAHHPSKDDIRIYEQYVASLNQPILS